MSDLIESALDLESKYLTGFAIDGQRMGTIGYIGWNLIDHGSYAPDASNAVAVGTRLMRAEKTILEIMADWKRLRAANTEGLLKAASNRPILSKYHGRNGFELERFIADYEAWTASMHAAFAELNGGAA